MRSILARSLLFLAVFGGDLSPANAQRSLEAIRQASSECTARMAISREYLALKPKIGVHTPPGMHLGDKATPAEARQLDILLREYQAPCRRHELDLARIRLPPMVPVLEAMFARSDANYQRLIAGEITWAEFREEAVALAAEVGAEIQRVTSAPNGPSLDDDPTDPAKR